MPRHPGRRRNKLPSSRPLLCPSLGTIGASPAASSTIDDRPDVRLRQADPVIMGRRQAEGVSGVHIILVEDDAQLGAAIQRALERLSYTVTWLRDGRSASAALADRTADLVLLDLGLPGRDGLDVLTAARRAQVDTPVIVMTARDGLQSRVKGLDAGADDYLVKPFHLDELAARIRSLMRRHHGRAVNRIEAGALSLDLESAEVRFRDEPVELTRREFALLQQLMERAGQIVRREQLE